jgi:hypothetical protein
MLRKPITVSGGDGEDAKQYQEKAVQAAIAAVQEVKK